MDSEAVARVLSGAARYDHLTECSDQETVRAAWETAIKAALNSLDYERQFLAAGESWWEAGEEGELVLRNPRQRST